MSYRHLKVSGCPCCKGQERKVGSEVQPCIFLGYDDDEFGYRVWDLVDKKVFRSRDIVFMEHKTIADWESEKKIADSGLTDRDRSKDVRTHPAGSRTTLKEPVRVGQESGPTKDKVLDTRTGQDPKSDSDEE